MIAESVISATQCVQVELAKVAVDRLEAWLMFSVFAMFIVALASVFMVISYYDAKGR